MSCGIVVPSTHFYFVHWNCNNSTQIIKCKYELEAFSLFSMAFIFNCGIFKVFKHARFSSSTKTRSSIIKMFKKTVYIYKKELDLVFTHIHTYCGEKCQCQCITYCEDTIHIVKYQCS